MRLFSRLVGLSIVGWLVPLGFVDFGMLFIYCSTCVIVYWCLRCVDDC